MYGLDITFVKGILYKRIVIKFFWDYCLNSWVCNYDKRVMIELLRAIVTPQNRGSVDYPSTHGIQVEVGLPDATLENRAKSPLYGELYPNTKPAYPVPNSPIYIQYGHLGP